MNWNPPDVLATLILSIPGGVVASAIVIVFERVIAKTYELKQQRKATNAVKDFFKIWESQIRECKEILDTPNLIPIQRGEVQLAMHREFLQKAHTLIQRWSKYLREE